MSLAAIAVAVGIWIDEILARHGDRGRRRVEHRPDLAHHDAGDDERQRGPREQDVAGPGRGAARLVTIAGAPGEAQAEPDQGDRGQRAPREQAEADLLERGGERDLDVALILPTRTERLDALRLGVQGPAEEVTIAVARLGPGEVLIEEDLQRGEPEHRRQTADHRERQERLAAPAVEEGPRHGPQPEAAE